MKFNLNNKQALPVILVLLISGLLAVWILTGNRGQTASGHHPADAGKAVHQDHPAENREGERGGGRMDKAYQGESAEPKKGPHGGKLFTDNGYGVEITIFEQGIEPEFRIYTYQDGKPLDPAAGKIIVTLERLGRTAQEFSFVKENDYLKGNAVVEEPHSFKVTIAAHYANKPYWFTYDQIEARVTLTDQQIKQNGVGVQTAGPARIRSTLRLMGEIRFNEDRLIHIVPRLTGIVESVSANAGDQVRMGQVLAVISSQPLSDLRSELLTAQKRLALARTIFEREKTLWQEKISAEQDYLQARNTLQEAEIAAQSAQQKLTAIGGDMKPGGNLTRYQIRSPIDGTVTDKAIGVGESLKEDKNIFVVADLSTVWAEMTLYPEHLNAIKVGQKAIVKAAAFEASGAGTLSYIGGMVNEQTRTAKARVVLRNPKGIWRPGLPVNVDVVTDEIEVPIAVSVDAIQTINDQPTVFGRYGDSFEARPVELGRTDGKFTELVKGLNAGERYAAENSFLIKADLGKSGASHDH
jgi:cobalt-zinc-cadmium efflux system membrane fusion protein